MKRESFSQPVRVVRFGRFFVLSKNFHTFAMDITFRHKLKGERKFSS